MRKYGRFALVGALLLSFVLSAVGGQAAALAPIASGLKATPGLWDPAGGRLSVSVNMSGAGNWRLELLNGCSGQVLRTLTGAATAAGTVQVPVDGTGLDGALGALEVRLTPSSSANVLGAAVSTAVTLGRSSTAAARELQLCPNAKRMLVGKDVKAEVLAAALRAKVDYPDAKSVFLVGASSSLAVSAVAAVAASQRGWPVLLTEAERLSYQSKVELRRRAAGKVVLLGSTKTISRRVADELRKLGYAVVRKNTDSPNQIAASIYSGVKGTGTAVFADLNAKRADVLQAVGFASAARQPLLHLDSKSRAEVQGLLKVWGRKGGTAIGSLPQELIQAVNATQLPTSTHPQTSLALARAVNADVSTAFLVADGANVSQWQLLTFARPQLLLVIGKSGIDLPLRTWVNARGDIQSLTTSDRGPSNQQVTQLARLIAARGEPTAIETLEPAALGPLSAPATFAFSGAGWGHGVGMSQWGAYQMAVEGKTAEEIVTHYYTGTKVEYAPASADVFVSLQNRISEVKARVLPLSGSTPAWRAIAETSDGTTSVTLTAAHSVTLKYAADGTVRTTISGPGELSLPIAANVRFVWSGTRYAGNLGDEPALIQVAGPGETLTIGRADSGRRYRFGGIRVKAATETRSLPAGLQLTNRVRLADEYIYGIGEVSSSWPSAALEAQVLTARSYAYYDVYNNDGSAAARSSTCDCHVFDDTRDQNYVGWSKLAESVGARWQAAVDASVGPDATALVVKYGNSVAQTFFAAGTGGATQNVQDVWGGSGRPYLVSVPDQYSLLPAAAASVARWSPRVREQQVLAAAFNLPSVATLDFSDRFASGALRTVTATAVDGTKATISGEQFRSRVKSSTGTTLNSTWVWRSLVSPRLVGARAAATDLSADVWLEYAKAPAASATSAVIVTQGNSADPAMFALAAAYAGARGWLLVPVAASGDETRVTNLLSTRGIGTAVLIGDVDADIIEKLTQAKVSVRTAFGEDRDEVSATLGDELPVGSDAVLFSVDDPASWPLAVSIATRTKSVLLPVSGGTLAPAVSLWLTAHPDIDVLAVGSASALPDRALAGITSIKRVNTADLAVASRVALQLGSGPVRAIALAGQSGNREAVLTVAALGFPLLYPDADNSAPMISWLRRQSLAAAVVAAGAEEQWVSLFSRS